MTIHSNARHFWEPDLARFWSRVKIPKFGKWRDACWEWQGALTTAYSRFGGDGSGYGQFTVRNNRGRKTYRAHRWIAEMLLGHDLGDQLVLHQCDNRKCVNPSHLRLGTHSENLREQYERDRRD